MKKTSKIKSTQIQNNENDSKNEDNFKHKNYLLGMLKVQTHFCKYKEAEIKIKQYGTSDFKTLRLSNIQTF